MPIRYFLMLVTLMFSHAHASAQNDPPSLQAELSKARSFVGDEVVYQIVVRGVDSDAEPDTSFPDSVSAEYRGASRQSFTSTRIINGRQQITQENRVTHQYRLTVRSPGTLVIPPSSMAVGGTRVRSNDVRLEVVYPERSAADEIEFQLPNRTVYVGEPVPLDVTWWIDAQTRDFTFDTSEISSSVRLDADELAASSSQQIEFDFRGQRVVAVADERRHNGRSMTRLRFRLLLTPTRGGEISIGPIRCVFTRISDFGRGTRMYAESERASLSVREIPASGRPDGFKGLIGRYSLEARVSNPSVNVGDPIELVLQVTGPTPLRGISDAIGTDNLTGAGFRVSPDGWRWLTSRDPGTAVLSMTVRATDERIEAIPPITIAAFDPSSGIFDVFGSEPVPLDVRAVRQVTLDDAVIAPGRTPNGSAAPREELGRNDGVLRAHNGLDEILGSPKQSRFESRLSDPVWLTYFGACFAAPCFAGVLAYRKRRHDPYAAELRKARKAAITQLRIGNEAHAARGLLSAALRCEPRAVTSADVGRIELDESVSTELAQTLLADESGERAHIDHQITKQTINSVVNAALNGRAS